MDDLKIRAKEFAKRTIREDALFCDYLRTALEKEYVQIANEQKSIDVEKAKRWTKEQNFSISVQLDLIKVLEN